MTEVEKPVPADLLVKGKDKVLIDEPMDMDLETGAEEEDTDLYTRLKTLQRQLEFYEIQVCTPCAACCIQEGRSACSVEYSRFLRRISGI